MKRNFSTKLTGWLFIVAALMLWDGWMLMPHHIRVFFQPEDFPAVYDRLRFWLWMYRIHLFGMVVAVLALVALGTLLAETEARILIWPGVAVASAGLFVSSVAAAFYYHFGVWGSIEMNGKSADTVLSFVDSLRVTTEYVTCLVRFGRVFTGLGLLVLALGLIKWKPLPLGIGVSAAVIGLAAMAITMALPDNLPLYMPVFHLQALWLAATGIITLRSGIRMRA